MKEYEHIEWKESWRDHHLRWVCGFANAEGGTLLAKHASVPFNPDVANAFFRGGHSVKTFVMPLAALQML